MKYWQGWLGAITVLSSPVFAQEVQPITLQFQAVVGRKPFSCGATYNGLAKVPVSVSDFRLYLSNLALLNEAGEAIPIALEQDGIWQYQNVALLDFENKTGTCSNGTEPTRTVIVGQIPKGTYRGLQFTLGVPVELNHADATLASAPLNLTSLWWNWQYGYKFLRLDIEAAKTKPAMPMKMDGMQGMSMGGGSAFFIHLGSVGCEKPAGAQTKCLYAHRPEIRLAAFDPQKNKVQLDLAALVNGLDVTKNQPNTDPGCMSDPKDADCTAIMNHLGLGKTAQTFFQVR